MSGRDGDGDGDERGERPRLSWSELDRRRDKPRSATPERRPRGAAAEARSRSATQSYLKKLDSQLFGKGGQGGRDGGAAKLAAAVRDALGTAALADACRAYLAQCGPPRDAALLAAFLDARDRDVQLAALGALEEEMRADRIAPSAGLRSQLRVLAEGSDDELAERAENLLSPR
ncbi:MAG: hypothetical protein DCC71_16145 [Proteobacteria bacterium]|nr:MAG: hypothetical protein DCC71_16145 [Pseudomonadota bacterium]